MASLDYADVCTECGRPLGVIPDSVFEDLFNSDKPDVCICCGYYSGIVDRNKELIWQFVSK